MTNMNPVTVTELVNQGNMQGPQWWFLASQVVLVIFASLVIKWLVQKVESQHRSLIELHRDLLAQNKEMIMALSRVAQVMDRCTAIQTLSSTRSPKSRE